MILRLSLLLLMFVFYGCTAATNTTLLTSEGKPCTENCTTSTPGVISGELSITPDEGEVYSTPEGTDLVEITGSCKDLGRKANRILVQVWEGEDDSVSPIIDNSIGITCQDNVSTSSLQSTAGDGKAKTCMLVSQGIGMADSGGSTPQFPQCFNGRFGFQLRLGRIIRKNTQSLGVGVDNRDDATNPRVRYLVKMKLRTTEGITADSGGSTMVVTRALATPTFSVTKNKDNDRCEVNFNPSKFRDIRYTLYTTWTGPSYAASGALTNSISGTVYVDSSPTFPPLGNGTTIEKFYHFGEPLDPLIGLMPGVNYTYRMQAGDYSYRNDGTPALTDYEVQFGGVAGRVERSAISGNVSCNMDPAYVSNRTEQNQGTGTPNSCLLTLAGYNTRGYNIEWRVSSTSPTWMVTNPNDGFLVKVGGDAATNCRSLPTCFVHGARDPAAFAGSSAATIYIDNGVEKSFQANTPYYFAARHYRDTNGNNQFDTGIDQIVGDWSPATTVANSSDYNHRCTFNTFPVQ